MLIPFLINKVFFMQHDQCFFSEIKLDEEALGDEASFFPFFGDKWGDWLQ